MNSKQRRTRDRASNARTRKKYGHVGAGRIPPFRRRWGMEEFFDILYLCWFMAEMRQRIETAVFAAFEDQPKIPFTDPGIKLVEDAIKKVLMESNELNLGYKQTVEFEPQQPGDRESRMLRSVKFTVPSHIIITGKLNI